MIGVSCLTGAVFRRKRMKNRRTDLALEAKELWQQSAGETTKLPGVRAREQLSKGITTTVVEILDQRGVRALNKPVGFYVTLELQRGLLREPAGFARAAARLGKELGKLLPDQGAVLVAGLGNGAVTPDAIGPRCLEHLVVTRHLGGVFPQLRPVSAIAPGVLGTTGLESVEVVRGIVERSQPSCVVVVDALASRDPDRICTTVQLTDTGIVPGSGVGHHRAAFDRDTLGVPVLAVGVPTVVEANTLLWDVLEENGCKNGRNPMKYDHSLVVTPKDIDARVGVISRLLGYGISLGLHRGLRMDDVSCLVG